MPTIEDVARQAGVSRSTVSLVLNRSPKVKEETRRLVEQVIREIQYVPNSNARGLSARTTNNLGVVIMQDYPPQETHISYNNDQHIGLCSLNISSGITAGLLSTDYGMITERFCSIAAPEELPRMVREKRVDGLFVVGLPYSDAFIPRLRAAGIPFVTVGVGRFAKGHDSVYADPYEGTQLAVRELIDTGHRSVCLINCSPLLPSHQCRTDAYRDVLESAGLPYRPSWNVSTEKNNGASAQKAFRAFWEAGNRPDAIVTANGQTACGVLRYLYDLGVRIPDDLSVISYEDSSVCGYAAPALTAVNIRKEEMGFLAARQLIRRIRHPEMPPEILALSPYLVRRDSVKPRI